MKVVVTGASGNIGSASLRELTAEGRHHAVGVARRRPELSDRAVAEASVTWRPADLGTDDLDPLLEGADAVVHLAWQFQPTHRPEETWRTNVVGTRRLLAAVRRQRVPALVCASSLAAYSPADHDDPVDEAWETDGASSAAYCREKAYNERVLDAFEATVAGIRVVRLRPAFVFQRSAASEQRRIFGGLLLRPWMLDRRRIPALPVPRGLRLQAVHAEDVAGAVRAAVERPVSGAFNLAGAGVLRREELGEIVGAPTVEVPHRLVSGAFDAGWLTRLVGVPGSLADALLAVPVLATDRAHADLDWQPRHTGAEAVEAFLSGAAQSAGTGMPPLHP
ncbi:NAD-dependent epimerase/dehydratase family protein [Nocardioides daeguensis]|uniref:NAD-dependent epimerase/dehydratase family protein n=1 Tax=Nocardioides daeguensis TaxID=908359 RepID=A0ABP6VG52_9ACTN|nr:NAD-dependent epimerase/dehydratase family protein [Nocardioides daeguensis]MBV6728932.1 NAD-dependent epimerase/dehydratase family protein [Nocardioides daeguensis]MCR1773453.1 NAD-dependent epimerase/dehydratase family protein [Nocardioides daeguensis]